MTPANSKLSRYARALQWVASALLVVASVCHAHAQAVTTTTVQGTVYLANGLPGSGTLQLSWPAFTTAASQAIAAGRTTVSIGADGFLSVNLAPNLGANPAGLYYTAVYNMSDGSTSTEYWVVPAAAQASIAQVRATVMPAAQAVQTVSKTYVDSAIQSAVQSSISTTGGTLSGPLYLSADPTQPLQAADKHYVDTSVTSLGAATLSTTTPQTFASPLAAPSLNASVNTKLNVQAAPYNAKGDCATDDSAAIQAALNVAKTSTNPVTVQLPAPSGGCYLVSTLQHTGASLEGLPPVGIHPNQGSAGVILRGKPGQDVYHFPDPNTTSGARPNPSWHIKNIVFQVDSSTDASASFPHRWPGRWAADAAMTSGSAVVTSTNTEFSCGDIGQAIRVVGAGAAGADLITTVSSVTPCWGNGTPTVTLAAAAGTTVSNAKIYTANSGLSATQTIGNCALAADNYDGNTADWVMTGNPGNLSNLMQNVELSSFNSASIYGQNHTCGAYFSGAWQPYGLVAHNVSFSYVTWGLVEAGPDTNPQSSTVGQDYQNWTHGTITATYPWTTYNQGFSIWQDYQLNATNGPQILKVMSAVGEYEPSRWFIRIPEWENGSGVVGTRIEGQSMTAQGISFCSSSTTGGLIETVDSDYRDAQCAGALTLGGEGNTVDMLGNDVHTALTSVTDNGAGNTVTGMYASSPYQSRQPASRVSFTRSRGAGYAFGTIKGDFVQSGNVATPYFSQEDLLFFPEDLMISGTATTVTADANSLTGRYVAMPSFNSFSQFNNIFGRNAVIGNTQAGSIVPATNVTAYVSYKCPSIASFSFGLQANGTTIGTNTLSCTTSYQTGSYSANLSSYSGQNLSFFFNNGEVDVAWIALVPQPNNQTFQGTTTLAGLTNSGTSNLTGAVTAGSTISAAGNIYTTGYTQQIYIGDSNTNRLDSSGANNGRLFSGGTQTIQGNTQIYLQVLASVIATITSNNMTVAKPVISTMFGNSTAATLAAGAAAGTSPTIACAASHKCTGSSGTISLTTGTSTTTGVLLTITDPNTHTNYPDCTAHIVLTASPYTSMSNDLFTYSTTVWTLNTGTALTASTAYTVTYQCAGY